MRLRVALLGCGVRARSVYLPVIAKMSNHFEFVGVCDRDTSRASLLAAMANVPAFESLEALVRMTAPDLLIVAVTPPPSDENQEAVIAAIETGVHVLAETPIASTMEGAHRVLSAARARNIKIEYAENYFRTPRERLITKLLSAQVFGKVHVAYSDFVGHGYHGISVLRSQIGFDIPVASVIGLSQEFDVQDHLYRQGEPRRNREMWQFAILEFASGARGVLSFSTLAYGSPLRWGREKALIRFYAERGMRFGEELAVLDETDKTASLNIRELWENLDGQPVLAALRVDGRNGMTWENPLRMYPLKFGDQHAELTIGLQCLSAHSAITTGGPGEYGILDAYYDRYVDLMIEESRRRRGERIALADPAAALQQ
jgi:predicted dehydrogenase